MRAFEEILPIFKQGVPIRRDCWDEKTFITNFNCPLVDITIIDGKAPWITMHCKDGDSKAWVASQGDLLAEDWVVAENIND